MKLYECKDVGRLSAAGQPSLYTRELTLERMQRVWESFLQVFSPHCTSENSHWREKPFNVRSIENLFTIVQPSLHTRELTLERNYECRECKKLSTIIQPSVCLRELTLKSNPTNQCMWKHLFYRCKLRRHQGTHRRSPMAVVSGETYQKSALTVRQRTHTGESMLR